MSCVDLYREKLTRYQALKTTTSGCEIEVIVHVTFSEKESETGGMTAIDVNECSSRSNQESRRGSKQKPFTPCILGYGHWLILTIGAGVGCLLGIFVANVIVYEQEWRPDLVSLLQLALAVMCSGGLVAIVLASSYFFHLRLVKKKAHTSSPAEESTNLESTRSEESGDGVEELIIVLKCRPDVASIMGEMQSYCQKNGIKTVGVSVCGPAMLARSVNEKAKHVSSPENQFVVDEETFDW
jgi:hypothetical protein